MRLLTYAVRRIADVPVVIVVAARSNQPAVDPLASALRQAPGGTQLHPAALTPAGGAQLVRRFVPAADDELCRTCHAATGGNPFLLSELARDLDRRGGTDDLGVPDRLVGAVLTRIEHGPPGSLSLARAVAVLGRTAPLRHAAVVAGLDLDAAGAAADALAAAEVLRAGRPLEFCHPILASAVAEAMPSSDVSAAHARAAHLLADEDGASELIGAHLLATEPSGDPWSCRQLTIAGRDAVGRGAPNIAVRFLRRALAEPPDDPGRAEVLLELGAAEALDLDLDPAIDHLRRGIDRLTDLHARLGASLLLVGVLYHCGRFAEMVSTLEPALRACEPGTSDLVVRAEADLVNATLGDAGTRRLMAGRTARLVRRVRSGEANASPTLAAAAAELVVTGIDASYAADLAERALASARGDHDRYQSWPHVALRCLAIAGRPELARRSLDFKVDRARQQGSLQELRALLSLRSEVAIRSGDLAVAEADVREVTALVDEAGWPFGYEFALANLIVVLVERDEHAAAAALVEAHLPDPSPSAPAERYANHYLLAGRGRLRLARGDVESGTADLLEVGRRQDALGESNPAVIDWRSQAALGLLRLGDPARAMDLAAQELALAQRFGAIGPIGVAERAMGLVEGGAVGLPWLQRAVDTLGPSPARLDHARALVDLGAALRRAGQRGHAGEALRDGAALAERCGATALQRRAMTELRATGARPRRATLTGRHALTASELRVAELAGAGRSNAHIAAACCSSASAPSSSTSAAPTASSASSHDEASPPPSTATTPCREGGGVSAAAAVDGDAGVVAGRRTVGRVAWRWSATPSRTGWREGPQGTGSRTVPTASFGRVEVDVLRDRNATFERGSSGARHGTMGAARDGSPQQVLDHVHRRPRADGPVDQHRRNEPRQRSLPGDRQGVQTSASGVDRARRVTRPVVAGRA